MLGIRRGVARLGWGVAALVAAVLSSGHPSAVAQEGADSDAEVRRVLWVTVQTRSNDGRVFCALWRGAEGYPTRRAAAYRETLDREIENRRAVMFFDRVVPDDGYAVACFHDENANNDLDRFLGIPREGTGASNGARGTLGPPRYDDARFTYPEGEDAFHIVVPIHYGF